jgi:hypothetical protein
VLHKSNTTSLKRMFTPDEMVSMSIGNPLSRKNIKAEKKRKEREARRLLAGGPSAPDEEMATSGSGSRSAEDMFCDMMED